MAGIAELVAKIVVEGSQKAVSEIKRVAESGDDLTKKPISAKVDVDAAPAEGAFGKIKSAGSSALSFLSENAAGFAAAGAGAIAGFAAKAIGNFEDLGVAVGKFSDATGTSTEDASRFIEVAEDLGIGADSMESAIGRMNKTLGQSPEKFAAAGVEIARLKDGSVDTAATFANVVDAINNIEDPARKAAVASQLLGKSWQNMAELIAQGGDGVRASLAGVESAKVLSPAQVAQAREFRDMMDKLQGVLESVSLTLGGTLVPALTDMESSLEDVTDKMSPLTDVLSDVWDVAQNIPGVADYFKQWLNPIGSILDKIGFVADAVDFIHDKLAGEDASDISASIAPELEARMKAANETADAEKVSAQAAGETAAADEKAAREAEAAARAAAQHAIKATEAATAVGELSSAWAEMGRRGDALSELFDLGNAPADAASATRDIAEGIAGLAKSAQGVKIGDILAGNLKGDAVLDSLDKLRPQVQSKITEAFAAGGPDAATAVADDYVNQIVQSLGGKLSADQVKGYLGLTDLEATLAVAVDRSSVARAKAELDVLVGLGGQTPFTASLKLAVDSGQLSGEAARAIAEWGLTESGVKVPLDPVTDPAALAEAQSFMSSFAAGNPVEYPTAVDSSGAAKDVQGFANGKQPTATVPLDSDPSKAKTGVDGFVTKTEATKPVVTVDAATTNAINTMLYLKILAAFLQPVVTLTANTQPALDGIRAVAAQHPQVPVTAYLADYPSSAEIAARIGRPRIPVDIVVGSSIRITGVRD